AGKNSPRSGKRPRGLAARWHGKRIDRPAGEPRAGRKKVVNRKSQIVNAMSYHIVNIDSPQCSLSCKDGQLTCKTADGERKLPLEDVASIIITSFSASIHSELFLQAAKLGVSLIICESFKPVSLVVPANRSTDTLLSRAMLNLTPRARALLWQRTVDWRTTIKIFQ